MRHLLVVAVLAVLAIVSHAQTTTVQDISGNTIIEVITVNPPDLTVTSTIETLAAAPTTPTDVVTTIPTTTSTTTAADQGEQGPVGQPAATIFTPGGPTPFTFTTVINGVTSVVQDIFTPTNPVPQQPAVSETGTIWDYSSWLAIYGPPTTTGSAGANGVACGPLTSAFASTLVLGFAVGMGLVLY
ncbi:hypothetical protein C0992_012727 [Termitomyces sp. T32_za158]|nr:hypothetical protein C0992_012727 [Termitomyces sp. T32_za158]